MTLFGKTVKGSRITLSVNVPAKGRLTASGAGLRTAAMLVPKAGTYPLTASLTADKKKVLKRRKKLSLTVKGLFTPATGSASSANVKLTVKAQVVGAVQ